MPVASVRRNCSLRGGGAFQGCDLAEASGLKKRPCAEISRCDPSFEEPCWIYASSGGAGDQFASRPGGCAVKDGVAFRGELKQHCLYHSRPVILIQLDFLSLEADCDIVVDLPNSSLKSPVSNEGLCGSVCRGLGSDQFKFYNWEEFC